jgi:hypothetical protein
MTEQPNWLPAKLEITEASEEVVDTLYRIFDQDFIRNTPIYDQRPIIFSPGKSARGYEVIFWHLVTGDYHAPGVDAFDIDRAERLPWCAPTINHALEGFPLVWDYEESGGKIRTYIWLKTCDYVVILQKENIVSQGYVARLITAYCINKEWGRKSLEKKYDRRLTT